MRKRSVETRKSVIEEMIYGDRVETYRLKKKLHAEIIKYFNVKVFY